MFFIYGRDAKIKVFRIVLCIYLIGRNSSSVKYDIKILNVKRSIYHIKTNISYMKISLLQEKQFFVAGRTLRIIMHHVARFGGKNRFETTFCFVLKNFLSHVALNYSPVISVCDLPYVWDL